MLRERVDGSVHTPTYKTPCSSTNTCIIIYIITHSHSRFCNIVTTAVFRYYISVAASPVVSIWSHCTYDDRRELFERNLDHCLKNIPETLYSVNDETTCGNYFIEEGKSLTLSLPFLQNTEFQCIEENYLLFI